ncbi:MAG: CrcB family protein [Sphingomonas sp.]|nr:CrcB family protein [Sphingomonas sp.]
MSYLLVALGGGIGAAMRHGVNRFALAQWGAGFPYGTLIVNVAGGLLMGIAAAIFIARGGGADGWRLFVTTGVLGGFTTFSAFNLEAALMWQRGDYVTLLWYVAASVLLSTGGLLLGLAVVPAVIGVR